MKAKKLFVFLLSGFMLAGTLTPVFAGETASSASPTAVSASENTSNAAEESAAAEAVTGSSSDASSAQAGVDSANSDTSALSSDSSAAVTESTASSAPESTVPLETASTPQEKFVTSLYANILGRTPDAEGLSNWTNAIAQGMTGSEMVSDFYSSPEFSGKNLSDSDFITTLYQAVLLRSPDPDGIDNWQTALNNGFTRKYVLCGFLGSAEFSQQCLSMGITPGSCSVTDLVDLNYYKTVFVANLYHNLLGRNPDFDGITSWVNNCINGASGTDIVLGFYQSGEFQSMTLSDSSYIKIMYRALLGREADTDGLNNWISVLSEGHSRQYVLQGFIGSGEFQGICQTAGINAGSYTSDALQDQYFSYAKFIANMYQSCLNRSYDTAGMIHWISSLVDGSCKGNDIATSIIFSSESTGRGLNNGDFVNMAYQTILFRSADPSGYAAYVAALNGGMSREEMVRQFLNSQEFQNVCASYGIPVETVYPDGYFADSNYDVLINIIGAIESGGMVYGNRDYTCYVPASSIEATCSLGWFCLYGSNAQSLVQRIKDADPLTFSRIDNQGIIANKLNVSWTATGWDPDSTEITLLKQIISSDTGRAMQDTMFKEMASNYVSLCQNNYTTDAKAIMMYVEMAILAGPGGANRIFNKLGGNYSMDNIFAVMNLDKSDSGSMYQIGDSYYDNRHSFCRKYIEMYAVG